jgi:hypothetical protein
MDIFLSLPSLAPDFATSILHLARCHRYAKRALQSRKGTFPTTTSSPTSGKFTREPSTRDAAGMPIRAPGLSYRPSIWWNQSIRTSWTRSQPQAYCAARRQTPGKTGTSMSGCQPPTLLSNPENTLWFQPDLPGGKLKKPHGLGSSGRHPALVGHAFVGNAPRSTRNAPRRGHSPIAWSCRPNRLRLKKPRHPRTQTC